MQSNDTRPEAPSEVFAGLWYYRFSRESLDIKSFLLCAETWLRLRLREDAEARDGGGSRAIRESPLQGCGESAAETQRGADQSADELEPHPASAQITPLARKKRTVLAKLQARRETGTGLQAVVDASGGTVTMDILLSALEAQPLTVSNWEAISKAISKAERARKKEAGT